MYKLMALLSLIIRNFYLPNPFLNLQYGLIINWMMEGPLHVLTFIVVGLFYESGSAPALGSLLYLVFYFIHTFIVLFMSMFKFSEIAIIIIFILYIMALITIVNLKNRYFTRYF